MRGMGIAAVVFIPVLIKLISEISPRSFWNYFFLTLITTSCLWSFSFIWQGETQYMNYSGLLSAQLTMLRRNDFLIAGISAIGLGSIVWGIRRYLKNENRSSGPEALSIVGLFFVFIYCVRDFQSHFANQLRPKIAILIITLSALFWVFLTAQFGMGVQRRKITQKRNEFLVGSFLCACFIISTILFMRVMVYNETVIIQPHKTNRISTAIAAHFITRKLEIPMKST
jgi:MFS family permease